MEDILIQGGGAQNAKDKVVQANGKGRCIIKDYTVVSASKLFCSYGNCSKNKNPRNVTVTGLKANVITASFADINSNYGDVVAISGSRAKSVKHVYQEFKGLLKWAGGESRKLSTNANCKGAQEKLGTLRAC